jgi:hypothetical protein
MPIDGLRHSLPDRYRALIDDHIGRAEVLGELPEPTEVYENS